MNYGALTGSELEKLVYIGDAGAKAYVAEHPFRAVEVLAEEALDDTANESYDRGQIEYAQDLLATFEKDIVEAVGALAEGDARRGLEKLLRALWKGC